MEGIKFTQQSPSFKRLISYLVLQFLNGKSSELTHRKSIANSPDLKQYIVLQRTDFSSPTQIRKRNLSLESKTIKGVGKAHLMGSASSNASSPTRPPSALLFLPMYALCTSPSSSSSFPGGAHSSLSFPMDDELHADAGSGIAASKTQAGWTSTSIRLAQDTDGQNARRDRNCHTQFWSLRCV
jgi:hypothetical protein